MKTRAFAQVIVLLIASTILLTSCLLPGMIPLDPEPTDAAGAEEAPGSTAPDASMPTMETDSEALLETLRGGEWVYLQALAEEEYTEEDYARPGTLTYTVTIPETEKRPTYFNYGWCTTTVEILNQNFEHIRIGMYFNGEALGRDVVHPVRFTRSDGFVCLDFGVMMSDWSPGEYQLAAVVVFEEEINDGAADFEAGDYIYEYNVTVAD